MHSFWCTTVKCLVVCDSYVRCVLLTQKWPELKRLLVRSGQAGYKATWCADLLARWQSITIQVVGRSLSTSQEWYLHPLLEWRIQRQEVQPQGVLHLQETSRYCYSSCIWPFIFNQFFSHEHHQSVLMTRWIEHGSAMVSHMDNRKILWS